MHNGWCQVFGRGKGMAQHPAVSAQCDVGWDHWHDHCLPFLRRSHLEKRRGHATADGARRLRCSTADAYMQGEDVGMCLWWVLCSSVLSGLMFGSLMGSASYAAETNSPTGVVHRLIAVDHLLEQDVGAGRWLSIMDHRPLLQPALPGLPVSGLWQLQYRHASGDPLAKRGCAAVPDDALQP